MRTPSFRILLFAGLTFLLLPGCLKKGPEDPALSLRSRKARVAGDWTVTSYIYSDTYNGSTYTYQQDSTSFIVNSPSGSWGGRQTTIFNFKRDGTYHVSDLRNDSTLEIDGHWNFAGGVGDVKNKSQLILADFKSVGMYTITWTGTWYNYYSPFDLVELRNNEMKWHFKCVRNDGQGNLETIEISETLTRRKS